MTKPLFHSHDVEEKISAKGIVVHYQEQFIDALTMVGGMFRPSADSARNSFALVRSNLIRLSECYPPDCEQQIGLLTFGGFFLKVLIISAIIAEIIKVVFSNKD